MADGAKPPTRPREIGILVLFHGWLAATGRRGAGASRRASLAALAVIFLIFGTSVLT